MAQITEPEPHRFTVDDVVAMDAAGILDPDGRFELLDGVLYDVSRPVPPTPAPSAGSTDGS